MKHVVEHCGQKSSTDYAGITLADALEQEQLYLMPMPAPFDGYIEVLARVSSTCLITLLRNRYSVPCRLVNQMVAVHQYANRIEKKPGALCNGAPSAEHVSNVLARLRHTDVPHV